MNNNVKICLMLCFIMCLVIFGPLIMIWAVNTLFKMTIEYTFQNWVAVVALNAFFKVSIKKGS